MAEIINGKEIAQQIKEEIKYELLQLKNILPGLAVILVGDNPASQAYVQSKIKACKEVGFYSVTKILPLDTPEFTILKLIEQFNNDPKIHGILVQLPLPNHISEKEIIGAINPLKDVDGFHPVNVGNLVLGFDTLKSCTPAGIQELLIRSGNDPAGKHVVVVGRSNIVGKPIANILLQKQKAANAVVTIVHTGTNDIKSYTLNADILIAAVGKPESITGDMLKPGVVVIDVGINRVKDEASSKGYKIVGDVHFESVEKIAKAITPVPGGVGPMTIAMLLKNTLIAAKKLSAS